MNRLYYILYIVFVTSLLSCNAGKRDGFLVIGEIDGLADSTILILKNVDDEIVLDTTVVQNNRFIFSGKVVDPPVQVVIRHGDRNWWKNFDRRKYYKKYLYIDNSRILIRGSLNHFYYAGVTGGPKINEELTEYFDYKRLIHELMDSLSIMSWNYKIKHKNKKLPGMLRIAKEKAVIQGYKKDLLFIYEHPDYELSARLLSGCARNKDLLNYNIPDERIIQLYNRLTPKWRNSVYGDQILNALKGGKSNVKPDVGMEAPDIEMADINKKALRLSSLKGKYVLLDFWSSGCGPCRLEHKNYATVYERFHKSGFEIFSVSFDKNLGKWKNATVKDRIIWINTCSLKGRNDTTLTKYKINYIPKNYLIDPNGYIIAVDLRGEALNKKLEKIIK